MRHHWLRLRYREDEVHRDSHRSSRLVSVPLLSISIEQFQQNACRHYYALHEPINDVISSICSLYAPCFWSFCLCACESTSFTWVSAMQHFIFNIKRADHRVAGCVSCCLLNPSFCHRITFRRRHRHCFVGKPAEMERHPIRRTLAVCSFVG